jgi:hypothetical protein
MKLNSAIIGGRIMDAIGCGGDWNDEAAQLASEYKISKAEVVRLFVKEYGASPQQAQDEFPGE